LAAKVVFFHMPFGKLGLSSLVLDGVKAMGYVDPTPIQLRAIPLVLTGRDVIGSAQTGRVKPPRSACPSSPNWASTSPAARAR
jgi:ATP-dependent RNA helicase RhlE